MDSAIKLISRVGYKKERVKATEIKSHADARQHGLFIDEEDNPVYWVNWSKVKKNGKRNRPYFSSYPYGRAQSKPEMTLRADVKEHEQVSESVLHRKARTMLSNYFQERVERQEAIKWSYKDKRISEFPLIGNFLADVEEVVTHYKFKTPFGVEYEYDVALLGPKIHKEKRIILGVVEVERTHRFGLLKLLMSKCVGFPLGCV